MNTKSLTVGLVVVAIIAIGAYGFPRVTNKVVEKLGAFPGPDILSNVRFHENFTNSGYEATTTGVINAFTLTSKELKKNVSYISWNPSLSQTLTTMASTSAPFVNLAVGEGFSVEFYSATTTAGATVTFAAGTGIDLQEDEGGTVVVNGLETSRLNFRKKADTDILMWVEVGQVGD